MIACKNEIDRDCRLPGWLWTDMSARSKQLNNFYLPCKIPFMDFEFTIVNACF